MFPARHYHALKAWSKIGTFQFPTPWLRLIYDRKNKKRENLSSAISKGGSASADIAAERKTTIPRFKTGAEAPFTGFACPPVEIEPESESWIVDVYRFYHQYLPDEGVLALEDLHSIVRDTWLTRFDVQLEAEQATRRKGRPKSTSQIKLEELKLRETEEYRTGLEVVDLTHGPTIELFKKWDQKETAYVEQLRFVRISSADPGVAVVSRPGKHPTLLVETDVQMRENT